MRTGFSALGMVIMVLAGCSHYSGSYPGGSANSMACDASPPNQPGCYERSTGEKGLINRLVDAVRESR
ncbi:hypothetical protein G7Z99_09825 [Pseudomonas entomophila]|uniref:hypothetical protein n=1 Tax=Pseudomonas entomophila TaxID=312306 RepID=UPI0015E28D72|nr:hypothetical protein [Pseudomonas entomophila]MBA1189342.1 hypothetical protein [Pseudomonas entomophila]